MPLSQNYLPAGLRIFKYAIVIKNSKSIFLSLDSTCVANSLDPDQVRQYVGPDLFGTLPVFLADFVKN